MHAVKVLAVGCLLVSTGAVAHSPYLLPNYFDVTQRDHVSVQGSFTEEFFQPDIVMKAEDYHVVGPDGVKQPLSPIYSKDLTVLDVDTKVAGTYRISTGLRPGSTRKATLVNGQWEIVESGEAPPDAVDMQSMTRADVYVSSGKPTDKALAPSGQSLEFHPLTHPNSLSAGTKARLVVLYEGKPLANQLVQLSVARAVAGNAPPPREFRSDGKGVVELTLGQAGLYHVMTRHRFGPAAGRTAFSYTVALTLEVAD